MARKIVKMKTTCVHVKILTESATKQTELLMVITILNNMTTTLLTLIFICVALLAQCFVNFFQIRINRLFRESHERHYRLIRDLLAEINELKK